MVFKHKRAGTGIDYAVEFITVVFILLIFSLIFFSCSKSKETKLNQIQSDHEKISLAKTSFLDYFNQPVKYLDQDMREIDFFSYSLVIAKEKDLFEGSTKEYFDSFLKDVYIINPTPPATMAPYVSKVWNVYVGDKGKDYEIAYLGLGCTKDFSVEVPLAYDGSYKETKVAMQIRTQGC